MVNAFAQGFLAAASLIVGAAVAMWRPLTQRLLGVVMAFGAGILISAVAYELVEEAFETSFGAGGVGLGLIAGALVFYAGDAAIDAWGGKHRKHSGGAQVSGSALAIVLGTILDGIPESIVLGVGLVAGTASSPAFLISVFLSNLPEAIASTSGLLSAGWPKRRIMLMWVAIALVSGVSAAVGYAVFADASPSAVAFVLAFAGGAVLTMLADTMMPEAFEHGGNFTGVVTTIGFGIGFAMATIS